MNGATITRPVELAAASAEDANVAHAFMRARLRSTGGADQWHVAVRNAAGQIYRTGNITGLPGLLSLAADLESLGFRDELVGSTRPEYGFDCIFSK